jgi:hypothetical protein
MPYPDDDYSSDTSTTGELVIGSSISGKLDYRYDHDLIKVWLQAGTSYVFSLSDTNSYPYFATQQMSMILTDGQRELMWGEGQLYVGGPAFEYTPATSGLYYLAVTSYYYGVSGGYSLSGAIKAPDPVSSDIHTTGVLAVGGSVHGTFEVAGDTDWYKIHVEAGQHYAFLTPQDGATTSVTGFQIYDASGKPLSDFVLEPASAGDYFISVSGIVAGEYNLASALRVDDYSQNNSTPGVLPPGAKVSGEIQYASDSDRFNLQVEAGKIYTLQLTGNATDQRMLRFTLYDETGKFMTRVGDQSYDDAPRTLTFTAAASGTYSILVSAENASLTLHRNYTLSASGGVADDFGDTLAKATAVALNTTIQGVISYAADTDVVKLTLLAGTTYALQLRPNEGETQLRTKLAISGADGAKLGTIDGGSENYTFTPSVSGTYYVSISGGASHYQLTPIVAADDWGASRAKAGVLAVGASATGTLEMGGGDRDWFALDMAAGDTYALTLQNAPGSTTPMYTNLLQPVKLNILNAQGQVMATVVSDTSSNQPLLAYTAASAGTYYVEVASTGGFPANRSYQLTASNVARDDVGNTPASAAPLAGGVAASGTLEVGSDIDVYKLSVVAGNTYAIQFSSKGLSAGQYPDTDLSASDGQADLYLRSVWNGGTAPGTYQLYTASTTGDIYLRVSARTGGPAASYQLTATSLGADDYANDSRTATTLAIGGALRGALGYADDIDMVKVTLEAGTTYQFSLQGKASGNGTLPTGYGNGAGMTLYDAKGFNIADDFWGADIYLGYTATQSGDYYLAIKAQSSSVYTTGSYSLQAAVLTAVPLLQGEAAGAPGQHQVTENIPLDFNQPVHIADESGIRLTDAAGQQWSIYYNHADSALTTRLLLNPYQNLAPGTTYTLDIAAGAIVDAAGHAFAGLKGYTFTTAPAAAAGTDGNDYLQGPGNGASLYGGAGTDTVIYTVGDYSSFLRRVGDHIEVTNYRDFRNPDKLYDIERLVFRDESIALDIDGVGGQAYRLYQAAFNRTPDEVGLGYWIKAMDGGTALENVATEFIASPEFARLYGPGPDDSAFLKLLYNNVLHRDPDASGEAYWLEALHNGYSRAHVLTRFSESPENQDATIGLIANGFNYEPYFG